MFESPAETHLRTTIIISGRAHQLYCNPLRMLAHEIFHRCNQEVDIGSICMQYTNKRLLMFILYGIPCLFSPWTELLFFLTEIMFVLLWLFFCSRLVFPVLYMYPNLCWYILRFLLILSSLFKTLIFCIHHFIINFFPI